MIDGIGRLAAANAQTLARCTGVLVPASLAPFAAQTLALSGITRNLEVWRIPTEAAQALIPLAQRSMQLQATVQEGALTLSDNAHSVVVEPVRWK